MTQRNTSRRLKTSSTMGVTMTRQIDRVTAATADVMRILPFAGPPAHMSRFDLAAGFSDIYRARLNPIERLTIASAALMSLDRDAAEQLAEATLSDLRAARPKRRART